MNMLAMDSGGMDLSNFAFADNVIGYDYGNAGGMVLSSSLELPGMMEYSQQVLSTTLLMIPYVAKSDAKVCAYRFQICRILILLKDRVQSSALCLLQPPQKLTLAD